MDSKWAKEIIKHVPLFLHDKVVEQFVVDCSQNDPVQTLLLQAQAK